MKNTNPFLSVGSIVKGDEFIGRKKEIKKMNQRVYGLSFGNLAIIGLPRIGKSSLVYSLYNKKDFLFKKKKKIVLWTSLSEYNDFNTYIKSVVYKIKDFLEEFEIDDIKINYLIENFLIVNNNIEINRFFKKILKKIKNRLGYNIIMIIDEFDNAKNFFIGANFQFLRSISYEPDISISIITTSRRTIKEIEKTVDSCSNFFQVFEHLYLSGFDKNDLLKYWNKFPNKILLKDKKSILYRTGSFPFLLGHIGKDIYDKNNISLDDIINDNNIALIDYYDSLLNILEEENLKNKLFQLVIGPMYDIKNENISRLEKYGVISLKEDVYILFGGFFREYIETVSYELDVWPIWSETEKGLRFIIKEWLDLYYGGKLENYFGENDKFLLNLKEIKKKSKKAFKRASDSLIDYTYPKDLFDRFIIKNYRYFGQILGKDKQILNVISNHISKIRNPVAHNNSDFLESSDRILMEGYCKDIIKAIENHKNNS